ncbi:MAG: hypothetical protein J6Q63_00010 [Bacteroidales bacterium]|nr:hypothetical protein [Bacteroidales bacterium]
MKKILFGMMAAAVLATSCAKELQDVAAGDATVTFTVGTPEIATRAYSDGTTATDLQYAVYDVNGNLLEDLTGTQEINISTTVELKLTTGNTYTVAFWADSEDAPYTIDFAAKSVSVDYTGVVSNDENLDAFYAWYTFTVTGAQTETVELKRPFAQLNVGAADYDASESAGYLPNASAVTVKNIYSTLNFATGEVTGETAVTFAENAIPTNEKFPVTGYDYLAMNYLLVAADKALVEVEFTYTDGSNAKTRTVGSVPVQRNYRTNIYGNILTSDVDLNVVIKPEYNEPDYEADAIQLIAAVGGTFEATEDIDIASTESPYINIDQSMVLDMNGHTLTAGDAANYGIITRNGDSVINDAEIVSNGGGLGITNGSSLTFNSGSIYIDSPSTSARYVFYLDGAGSTVIINGGDFSWDPKDNQKRAYVYAGTGTNVYINGGNFGKASTRSDYKSGILGDGNVVITGGTFGFDPTNWLADGYNAVKNGSTWYVVAEEIDAVAETLSDLSEALANGENVALLNDIAVAKSEAGSNGYGATGISQLNGGVIDGNGNDISVNAWGTWDSAINTTGGTIKNINVTGGMRGIFVNHNSTNNSKVILENVTIDGTVYTISCDQGTNQGLEAYNSTFNGWTSYAATIGAVKFDGCSFGEGQGYAYCRPYAATEFVNCDFAAGYAIDPVAAVTFENCTFGGVALTAANLSELVSNTANVTLK